MDNRETFATQRPSLAQILASLSYALDLAEGQPMGHGIRACLIGLRIATEYGLSPDELESLHYGLLLKDAGCSANSAHMHAVFGGDDIEAKRNIKIIDWCSLTEAIRYAVVNTMPKASLRERAAKIFSMIGPPSKLMRPMAHARSSRGSQIALSLGLADEAAKAICYIDEHWDGSGIPYGLKGEDIPIQARIACLAQTLEIFAMSFGTEPAFELANSRREKWFDPRLLEVAEGFAHDTSFWSAVRNHPQQAIAERSSRYAEATEAQIDRVCEAFATIVDAKSESTTQHSLAVRDCVAGIAETFGLPQDRRVLLGRAALLHDLGKLTLPNNILDKADELTKDEYDCVKLHPYYTWQILQGVPGFGRVAEVASGHHERLDGAGYFRGMRGEKIDQDMRILAVANAFVSRICERPYRPACSQAEAIYTLQQEAGLWLDAECIEALAYPTPQRMPMAA